MMITFWSLTFIVLSHVAFAKNFMPDPEYLDMLRATGQDEKFASMMGIQDASLVRANTERTEHATFSKVSDLGDILLTAEQSEQARQGLNFQRYNGNKWPNVMPYYVSRSDFDDEQRRTIDDALSVLNSNLRTLQFRHWQSGDQDFIYVISGAGCYSFLGKTGGWQTLSLQSNGCVWPRTIQHEFMHAAGLNHEQNRPDRDHYVKILWDNIPEEWQSQYQKGSYQDYGIFGDYDPSSVMHYGYYSPGTGKPAFEFRDSCVNKEQVGSGQNDGPTDIDFDKLNNMYFSESQVR